MLTHHFKSFKKIGFTRKKNYGYRERDETKRQHFLEELSTLPTEKIVYVDESGMDSRDEYDGWNLKGQRFHALKSGRRQGRINTSARALCNQNLMATFTVVGACNRILFETWLETCWLPMLKPGQVVVMDNAN